MRRLETLFLQTTGQTVDSIVPLTPAGSNRQYFRLTATGMSLVGVVGTSPAENEAFLAIDRQLYGKGLGVPQVMAVSNDRLCYLQEDLGDVSLFELIRAGKGDDLLVKTMRALPRLQFLGAEGFDFSCCYPLPSLDRRCVMWDLNYFKYCFLKPCGVEFSEPLLEDDFERLADRLLQEPGDTFMYRDFQSRNVMVKDGEPRFIDFQGGRRGPIHYDVASFLWQARAGFTAAQRDALIDVYLDALQPFRPIDRATFMPQLRSFVLFRLLQVLGAYGYRGWFERKAHFLQSIPMAVESLRSELAVGFAELPYLTALLQQVTALPRFAPIEEAAGLTVDVCSFSYRRGVPDDPTDHGGGFIFDCRAIHNPGRYDAYKASTGHDADVVAFLDATEGMTAFLQHVYALVDQSVERYLARGFTHLSVSFGCTGGQHRSVYAADHLAAHLAERWPEVTVRLTHREQPQLNGACTSMRTPEAE